MLCYTKLDSVAWQDRAAQCGCPQEAAFLCLSDADMLILPHDDASQLQTQQLGPRYEES